jgi:hypothetical protein
MVTYMINQEFIHNTESKLAMKCRLALEKSYGGEVPKPNFSKETANFEGSKTTK